MLDRGGGVGTPAERGVTVDQRARDPSGALGGERLDQHRAGRPLVVVGYLLRGEAAGDRDRERAEVSAGLPSSPDLPAGLRPHESPAVPAALRTGGLTSASSPA